MYQFRNLIRPRIWVSLKLGCEVGQVLCSRPQPGSGDLLKQCLFGTRRIRESEEVEVGVAAAGGSSSGHLLDQATARTLVVPGLRIAVG